MSVDMVNTWKTGADDLNDRLIPGRLYSLPPQVRNNLLDNVLYSMTLEWEQLVKVFKNIITHPPKRKTSQCTLYFGREKVRMRSQAYRDLFLNLLLRTTLFGVDYHKMHGHEVIYKSKKVTLVHIASYERMMHLFTLAGLCGVTFYNIHGYTLGCCGKVNIYKNGRNIVGYILEETNDKWTVYLEMNKFLTVGRLHYDKEEGKYKYPVNL